MVKQGYKQTEVGVIPEDWDVRKIGDFTDATAGGTPSTSHPEYWNGEILWMSSGELNKRRIHNVIGRITELGYNNSSTHMIPENCVLIGLAGQGKTRGTVAVNYVELCTNQSIAAIFPSKEHNSEYLYQNLWSRYEELRELSSGDGGRGGLNLTIIKNFPCAFPKPQEQKRIAEALSDVDSMISSLKKLIAKKKAVKQGTMQELLTGKKRLPGFTGEWVSGKWKDVLGCFSSGATPYRGNSEFYKGTIKWVSSGELNYNYITDTLEHISYDAQTITNLTLHPAGTFLMAITGLEAAGTRGSCAILGTAATTNQSCMAIYGTEKMSTEYLFHYYVQNGDELAIQYCQGTKQQSYTAAIVKELPIYYPEDVAEQNVIASILSDMDKEIETLEQKLAKNRQIKQGMMQQLLTGKIRLV